MTQCKNKVCFYISAPGVWHGWLDWRDEWPPRTSLLQIFVKLWEMCMREHALISCGYFSPIKTRNDQDWSVWETNTMRPLIALILLFALVNMGISSGYQPTVKLSVYYESLCPDSIRWENIFICIWGLCGCGHTFIVLLESKSFIFYNNFKGIDDSLYRIMNMSFLLVSLPTQIGAGRENGGRKKLTGLYRVLYPCIGLTSLLSWFDWDVIRR